MGAKRFGLMLEEVMTILSIVTAAAMHYNGRPKGRQGKNPIF
jgi:hypothetical protein